MKKLYVVAAVLVLSACSAKLITPTQADADRGAEKYPGVTLEELTKGKELFKEHCGSCHPYKNVTKGTEEQWNKVVPEMVQKVNKKAKQQVLGAAEQDLILKYTLVMNEARK